MYASKIIFTTIFAVAAFAVSLPRQAGNAACNQARGQVVSSLKTAGQAIAQIQDARVQSAAQAGLDEAKAGVQAIAQTLIANQTASAAGRDEVGAGLRAMSAALAGGNLGDAAVVNATTAVQAAATAGQNVVSECK